MKSSDSKDYGYYEGGPVKSHNHQFQVSTTLRKLERNGSHYQYVGVGLLREGDPPFDPSPYVSEPPDIWDWEEGDYDEFDVSSSEGFLLNEIPKLVHWLLSNYGSDLTMISIQPYRVSWRFLQKEYEKESLGSFTLNEENSNERPLRVRLLADVDSGIEVETDSDLINITGATDLQVAEGLFTASAIVKYFEYDSTIYEKVHWWLFRPFDPPFDPNAYIRGSETDAEESEHRFLMEAINNSFTLGEVCALVPWLLGSYGDNVTALLIRPARTNLELKPVGALSVGGWDDFLMLTSEQGYSLPFDAWAYFDILGEEPVDDETLCELETHEILSLSPRPLYLDKFRKGST